MPSDSQAFFGHVVLWKFYPESDFDVELRLEPSKSAENVKKPKKKPKTIAFFFDVKKSKIANRPKRVLKKFHADRSHAGRVRRRLGRSAKRKQYEGVPQPPVVLNLTNLS